MNLAIDIGNTFVKLGLFADGALVQAFEGLTPEQALAQIRTLQPTNAMLSSVGAPTLAFQTTLAQGGVRTWVLSSTTPVPLRNHYQTPETLGTDRLAAVVGAMTLHPEGACLVIDLGTCITYDFLDGEHRYWGGSISPGLRMRLKAMHSFTSRLPALEPPTGPETELVGRNTQAAMLSGAVNGTAAELDGIIAAYAQRTQPLRVVACGGDAAFFERQIKARIFVAPNLVLIGLNRILQYNLSLE